MIRKKRKFVSERDTLDSLFEVYEIPFQGSQYDPEEEFEEISDYTGREKFKNNFPSRDNALSKIGDVIESAREISSIITSSGVTPNKNHMLKLSSILEQILDLESQFRIDIGEDDIDPL